MFLFYNDYENLMSIYTNVHIPKKLENMLFFVLFL